MTVQRRRLLKAAGALAGALVGGLMKPLAALAATWNKQAFSAKSAGDALKTLGMSGAQASNAIIIEAPQIAENGAVVPIEIMSKIAGTTNVSVLIEKNPYPLVASFDFTPDAIPYLRINAKMAETSDVRVVATAGGKHYAATKQIKVTIGGCGG